MKRMAIAMVVATVASACTIGEDVHEYVTYEAPLQAQSRTCNSPFQAPDLASAKACGGGKGHCYDASRLFMTGFSGEECDGGTACVPDMVLNANGAKLKSCAFFLGGKPGVCISTIVPDVAAHQNELQPDVCDAASERCVPCVDPRNGADTHVCDPTGVHTQACVGGANQAAERLCCHGSGTCMKEDAVPEDQHGSLSRETCGNGQVCAPRSLVNGSPVKCDVLGIADGVCLDLCFASMLRSTQKITRGGCGPTEVCVPCLVGKGQGMPGC